MIACFQVTAKIPEMRNSIVVSFLHILVGGRNCGRFECICDLVYKKRLSLQNNL